jgi:arsenate reductase
MKNVLVLCTANSCRSQIAEGYLKHFTRGKVNIYSAGTEKSHVNLRAIASMQRDGIDISQHTSNDVSEYKDIPFDYVITVCDEAKESCPVFPGEGKKFHHGFKDPAKMTGSQEKINSEFDRVRGEIKSFCKEFAAKHLL